MVNEWVIIFRLILAAVLSGIIGFEREFHGRAAGFRTHILLCIGSTLVMLTSMHIFDIYYNKAPCDPGRIAAGVVTGIGFLGAGAIMRSRASVRGLTTAASLWVVAALGLAIGSGLYFASILTTVLTVIALLIFSRIEHAMIRKDWYKTVIVEMKESVDSIKGVKEILDEHGCDITDFDVERSAAGGMVAKFGVKFHSKQHDDVLISDISTVDGVKSARWQVS